MATATHQNEEAQDQFELVVRLQQSRTSHPTETALGSSSAHALVHDILKARLQVTAQEGGENYIHASGYSNLGKALAAGRALQIAFEGFRSAAPAARTTISVVLDALGAEEAPTGPSVEQRDLLALARPSQVLITQALYNRIAQAQPVQLRSFPPCAGVYEFLWTSAERLDELRAESELTPTLVGQPEPAFVAEEETVVSYPAPRFSEPAAHDTVLLPRMEPPVARVYEDDEEPSRPLGKIVGLSALAAVLLAGVGFAVWRSVPPTAVQMRRPPVVLQTQIPATVPPVAPTVAPPMAAAPAPILTKPPVLRPEIKPPVARPEKTPLPATQRNGRCSIEAYEIPQYLDLADKNRNRGDYDAAEREYTTVLGCQPGNRAARDGLARLKGH